MPYYDLHAIYDGTKIRVCQQGTSYYDEKAMLFEYLYFIKENNSTIIIAETKKDGKVVIYSKNKKEISNALSAINSDKNGPYIDLIKENLEIKLKEIN